jgi:hypothetical protein
MYSPVSPNLGGLHVITPGAVKRPTQDLGGANVEPLALLNFIMIFSESQNPSPYISNFENDF